MQPAVTSVSRSATMRAEQAVATGTRIAAQPALQLLGMPPEQLSVISSQH